MVNKLRKEIEELKKRLNGYENYFNDEEENRIKKITEINELKKIKDEQEQEIQELKEKLEDKNNDDDMPYLETEKEEAEGIADFHEKKGKGYVDLPILLSKLNINSSKELLSNIKQLINNLYDNEQITKQVYNNLIKAITYEKMTRRAS